MSPPGWAAEREGRDWVDPSLDRVREFIPRRAVLRQRDVEARGGFDKAGATIIGCAVMAERIAAILPAFNEEAALPGVLKELAAVGAAQIIVVDNGSSDETAEVARRGGAEGGGEPRR